MWRILWAVVVGSVLVGGMQAGRLSAEHRDDLTWMRPYRGAGGLGCCSERDCIPVPVRLLALDADQATVEIHGTVLILPKAWVHLSEVTQTYWCCRQDREGCATAPTVENTRCVFIAIGS